MDETLLYNGKVRLSFDPRRHVYTVSANGGRAVAVPSITSVLGVIGKGDALTQWAANCAADYVRDALRPGVPLDEVQIERLAWEARTAFRRQSRSACDIGRIVHAWIETYLQRLSGGAGAELPELPVNPEAANACRSAAAWLTTHSYSPLGAEIRLYSLRYEYAGTADSNGVAASVNGRTAIVDWKTSRAIYPEYRFQTAAYAQAFSEMTGQRVRDRWIVRIGKDGSLEDLHLPPSTFRADLDAFLAALKIHKRLRELESTRC